MPEITHDLTPIAYLYRGHYIERAGHRWVVTAEPGGVPLFFGDSTDDCKAAIDEVCDS